MTAVSSYIEDGLLNELKELVGDRVHLGAAIRDHHGHDMSYHENLPPDAVIFAHSTEEVSSIVKLCSKYEMPVIPFGTGTALEGHVNAVKGGICIDLSEMSQILKVNVEDLDATVQAGVTRKQLNEHLRDTGLFFPVDPGADASLGGMAATRASGTNAVRYGTMRENVISLTVVLADGRIIKTSRRSKKSAAGYDLTRLFVGSEGTLGVITEVTLKLYGIPEAISSAVCSFPDLASAINTVILVIQCGIPIARIELLDEVQMAATNSYSDLSYPEVPTLFFEFHGSEASVSEQATSAGDIAKDFGGKNFQWATKTEDRNKLWQARHDVYFSALALRPGAKVMATDVCVPISRLADCILETRTDIDNCGMIAPIVGHVGDGNFHVSVLLDTNDEEEMRTIKAFNERLIMRALAMDGTCTGEHGVGSGKIDFLTAEHGEGVSLMRTLKIALDPDNIMNPGKVVRI